MPGRSHAQPVPADRLGGTVERLGVTVDRPAVTVRDPSRRPGPPDLIDTEVRQPRGPDRRGPLVVLVVVALLVAGAVLLERRADQPELRQADGAVDLVLTDRFGFQDSAGARVSSRASLVGLDVEVRNDGPTPLVVDRAVVGDFRFVGEVELAAGQDGVLPLVRTVTCPADGGQPPLDPVAEGLRLQLVTATGPRSLLVSPGAGRLERLRTSARRACGFLPVREAVKITAITAPGVHGVRLVVHNASVRALLLLEVSLPTGLRLDAAPRLPVRLPPVTSPGAATVPVLVDLPVVPDCPKAPRNRKGRLLPLPRPTLGVSVGDGGSTPMGMRPTIDALTGLRGAYYDSCA